MRLCKLYALVLELSPSQDYTPIRPIRIPFLCVRGGGGGATEAGADGREAVPLSEKGGKAAAEGAEGAEAGVGFPHRCC